MTHALRPLPQVPVPPIAVMPRPDAVAVAEPVFLDIEASSLAVDSWPIEIGWAWVEGGAVVWRSSIVAPRASWPASAWSEAAFGIHGLSRERIARGRDADAVAAMTDVLAGRRVVSDNPAWDQRWLDRLREGRDPIPVLPLRTLRAGMTPRAADAFALALLRSRATHRAGADAARLARAWAAAAAA